MLNFFGISLQTAGLFALGIIAYVAFLLVIYFVFKERNKIKNDEVGPQDALKSIAKEMAKKVKMEKEYAQQKIALDKKIEELTEQLEQSRKQLADVASNNKTLNVENARLKKIGACTLSQSNEMEKIRKQLEAKDIISVPAEQALYIIKNFDQYNFFSNENGEIVFKPMFETVIEKKKAHGDLKTSSDIEVIAEAEVIERDKKEIDLKDPRPYGYLGKEAADIIESGKTYNEDLKNGSFKLHSHKGFTLFKDGNLIEIYSYSVAEKARVEKQQKKDDKKKVAERNYDDIKSKIEQASQATTVKEEVVDKKESMQDDEQQPTSSIDIVDTVHSANPAASDIIAEVATATEVVSEDIALDMDEIFSITAATNVPKKNAKQGELSTMEVVPFEKASLKAEEVTKLFVDPERFGDCGKQLKWFAGNLIELAVEQNPPLLISEKDYLYLDMTLVAMFIAKYIQDIGQLNKKLLNVNGEFNHDKMKSLFETVDEAFRVSECENFFSQTLSGRWGHTCGYMYEGMYIKTPVVALAKGTPLFAALVGHSVEVTDFSLVSAVIRKHFKAAEPRAIYTGEADFIGERLEAAHS